MFIDQVRIQIKAGDGGNGCMAFRREKYVPHGGPSGGDGGRGGDIVLVSSEHYNTLLHFRFNPEHKAERGRHGEGSNCTGRNGADVELPVPVGTIVYDDATANSFTISLSAGERFVVALRRARRARQRALRHLHSPGADRARTRPAGPGNALAPGAQTSGRRRAGGLPQRRQVDPHLAHLGRAPQDCRLSLHHPRAKPGRRADATISAASSWPISPA